MNRRTAIAVRDGRVAKKNNSRLSTPKQCEIRIERHRPPEGFRHLLTVGDVRRFVDLLPDWDDIAVGLEAIILDGSAEYDGWYHAGTVAICPWQHDLWDWWSAASLAAEGHVLDLLGVERIPITDSREHAEFRHWMREYGVDVPVRAGDVELRWTVPQARAYQLLHVLPHELGHHHDRMSTRSRRRCARGERYAEAYANRVLEQAWPAYVGEFGI